MPLDPQQKTVLDAFAALGNPKNETLPAAVASETAATKTNAAAPACET